MKKVAKIVSAAIVSTAFMGTVASAATCDNIVINGTGGGSNNTVTCNVALNVNVTCTTGIYTLTSNSQTAVSGAVEAEGNTTGGAAISGNATNENGETVAIGTSCALAAAPSTPETPGKGGGAGAFTPEVLPNTSNDSPALAVLGVIAAATGITAVSRMAVIAYRKALR